LLPCGGWGGTGANALRPRPAGGGRSGSSCALEAAVICLPLLLPPLPLFLRKAPSVRCRRCLPVRPCIQLI